MKVEKYVAINHYERLKNNALMVFDLMGYSES